MLKYLIKSTNEIRVESEEDANALHKEYEQFAHDYGYVLSSWTQTYRNKKSSGEIIAEWFICKVVLVFNDAKDPDIPLEDINFKMQTKIPVDSISPWDEA